MEKVRIGNDMRVNFSVYRNGEPESFDGASNIVTKLVNEAYNKLITHTYTIAGNIVQFGIDALQLTQCGKCRLFISYTKGGDYTVDSPAFELVNYTDQTGGTEIIGVEIVSINISGDIGINMDGLSAYEVWESYPGNEGKTIEEYFVWLRENPTKIDLNGLNSNIDKLHFNPDTLVQLANVGDVRYSSESRTLEVKVSDTVSIQLGQEMQTRVKNNAGTQINNGQMVYIDSAAGANPLAKIASTSNADIAQRTFGMATENIPANGFGAITTEGLVRDINTSSFPEGAMLWLGANGSVTNIEPVAPTSKISVGMVLRSNTNNGIIYVKIRAIARNQKLSDVYAPTLTTGDVLRWNSATLRFEVYNLSNKADLVAGKIPASQLPAYVDDIIEYANLAAFPAVGETGKLYVTLDTNLTYRWSGSAYTEVSKSLAIGITSTTAFRGDWGKIAYDHSQLTNSNPHGTTAAQIANTPAGTISAATVQAAINELDADRVQLETDLNSYNVTYSNPLAAGLYYNLTSAITACPVSVRKAGLKLTFLTAISESDILVVSTIPSTAGNVVITLNGVSIPIAIDPLIDTTTTLVADKVRATPFSGWAVSGTGSRVVFTKNVAGICSSPSFDAGGTGISAYMLRNIIGENENISEYQFNGSSTASWTDTTKWRKIANENDIDKIVEHPVLTKYTTFVGGFIVLATGALSGNGYEYSIVSDTSWLSTPYVKLTAGKIYATNGDVFFNWGQAALYDYNKIFIPNPTSKRLDTLYGGSRNGWYFIIAPAGSQHLRISTQGKARAESTMLIEVDSVSDLDYIDSLVYKKYDDIKPSNYLRNNIDHAVLYNLIAGLASLLYGKKIIVIGDSMVYGNTVGTKNVWLAKIAARNGMEYEVSPAGNSLKTTAVAVNAGINGVCLSYNSAPFSTNIANSVYNRYPNVDSDADYILVFAGTNDAWKLYRGEMQLGTENSTDPTTLNGALNLLMQGLLTKFPAKKIGFITPYDNGDASRKSVINAIKSAGLRNKGIPVFDNSELGGIDFSNAAQATALTQGDGVHLNATGHLWVSSKYEQWLKGL